MVLFAISEIVRIPITEKFANDFFIAGSEINEGSLSIIIFASENFDQIIMMFGERIRDMIFIKEKNIVLMAAFQLFVLKFT